MNKLFTVFELHSSLVETKGQLVLNLITVTALAVDGSTIKWLTDKKSLPQMGYEFTLELPIVNH